MEKLACIILAAGMGKRMGSSLPKALVQTSEAALIEHVLNYLAPLKPSQTIIVTGHQRELLESHVSQAQSAKSHSIQFAPQGEQLGTGDAVKSALPYLEGFNGTVLITYADAPLFLSETLKLFLEFHTVRKATLSLISFSAPVPNNYGRIVREAMKNCVKKIVEAKDCSIEQVLISESNSGVYAVDSAFLKPAVTTLTNNNAQKEYYLTDIIEKAVTEGQTVEAFLLSNSEEAEGINNQAQLAHVNSILAKRRVQKLVDWGVQIEDPRSCFVDSSVTVEAGCKIGPSVQLRGSTILKSGATIEGTAVIINSIIGEDVVVKLGTRIEGATLGKGTSVGPFANLRPGTVLGENCRIGNFVETKNAELANGAKASHLTYLGDCTVGEDTNIGAGTITCNYDGYSKFKTEIGKGVFIGSNSALVAPISIGDGALVAAGSTITKNVAVDSLGISRAKQEVKSGWAKRWREAKRK